MKNSKLQSVLFICISLCLAAVILISTSCFNRKYDYMYNLHPYEHYIKICSILNRGQYIYNHYNCDYRMLKEVLIKNREVPDILSVGSSTSMSIHSDYFQFKSFLNAWMTQSYFEEILGIFGLYLHEYNTLPTTIIISLDSYYFEDKKEHDDWKFFKFYTNYFLKEANKNGFHAKYAFFNLIVPHSIQVALLKLSKSLSPELTKNNFIRFRRGDTLASYYVKDYAKIEKGFSHSLHFLDGSSFLNPSRFRSVASFGPLSAENKIDENMFEMLITTVKFLKSKSVNIIFRLAAVHPEIYERHRKSPDHNNFVVIEEKLIEIARQSNVPIIGSFNPEKIGWTENDFSDYKHPHPDNIKDLFIKWQNTHKIMF